MRLHVSSSNMSGYDDVDFEFYHHHESDNDDWYHYETHYDHQQADRWSTQATRPIDPSHTDLPIIQPVAPSLQVAAVTPHEHNEGNAEVALLKVQINSLKANAKKHEHRSTQLTARLDVVESQVMHFRDDVDEVAMQCSECTAELDDHRITLQDQEELHDAAMATMKTEMARMRTEMASMRTDMAGMKAMIEKTDAAVKEEALASPKRLDAELEADITLTVDSAVRERMATVTASFREDVVEALEDVQLGIAEERRHSTKFIEKHADEAKKSLESVRDEILKEIAAAADKYQQDAESNIKQNSNPFHDLMSINRTRRRVAESVKAGQKATTEAREVVTSLKSLFTTAQTTIVPLLVQHCHKAKEALQGDKATLEAFQKEMNAATEKLRTAESEAIATVTSHQAELQLNCQKALIDILQSRSAAVDAIALHASRANPGHPATQGDQPGPRPDVDSAKQVHHLRQRMHELERVLSDIVREVNGRLDGEERGENIIEGEVDDMEADLAELRIAIGGSHNPTKKCCAGDDSTSGPMAFDPVNSTSPSSGLQAAHNKCFMKGLQDHIERSETHLLWNGSSL